MQMKKAIFRCAPILIALTAIGGGCSSLDRSRSLADSKVPVRTTAQQVCSNCHGMDGNSVSPNFPRLAAQTQDYLMKQLKDYRGHNRQNPPAYEYMWGISRSLTDQQIEGLAKYFTTQKPTQNVPGNPKLVTEGERIYKEGIPSAKVAACAGCHGDSAQGNEQSPRLAGQHSDYLIKQLQVFKRGDERPAPIMEEVAHSLTPDNMTAVANYLQGMVLR